MVDQEYVFTNDRTPKAVYRHVEDARASAMPSLQEWWGSDSAEALAWVGDPEGRLAVYREMVTDLSRWDGAVEFTLYYPGVDIDDPDGVLTLRKVKLV